MNDRRAAGDWSVSARREALAYADGLHSLARYLTGADGDAEDLVQEAYARAFAAECPADGGNLKAWLFRILRNLFVDSYRRRRHGPIDTGAPPPDEAPTRADNVSPGRAIAPRDIEAALLALPEEGRTAVLLDLEGLTESESAAVLGCAAGTVKSRLSRARAQLRRLLVDYEEDL
jgi:RNA polymerase sigma-70 factor (ECF subfamily)